MKKFARTATALALAAAMAVTFTGCGEQQNAPVKSKPSNQNAVESIISELDGQIVKSKVTSADSTAKAIINTVNIWITDNITCGGEYPSDGTVEIICSNGNFSVTGAITDANKAKNNSETLADRFKIDYPEITLYSLVHINDAGMAYAVICTNESGADSSDIPPREIFDSKNFSGGYPKWTWNGKTAGVSPTGKIVGTYPKVMLAKQ